MNSAWHRTKVFYIFWNETEREEACNRLNTPSISLQHLNTKVQFSSSFSSENVGESLYIKGDFGCCTLRGCRGWEERMKISWLFNPQRIGKEHCTLDSGCFFLHIYVYRCGCIQYTQSMHKYINMQRNFEVKFSSKVEHIFLNIFFSFFNGKGFPYHNHSHHCAVCHLLKWRNTQLKPTSCDLNLKLISLPCPLCASNMLSPVRGYESSICSPKLKWRRRDVHSISFIISCGSDVRGQLCVVGAQRSW